MKLLRKKLNEILKEKYNLRSKTFKRTKKRIEIQFLLNDSLKREDYEEYLNLTVLKLVETIKNIEEYNYFNVKLEKIEKNVYTYKEENDLIYKTNIYRLTVKFVK